MHASGCAAASLATSLLIASNGDNALVEDGISGAATCRHCLVLWRDMQADGGGSFAAGLFPAAASAAPAPAAVGLGSDGGDVRRRGRVVSASGAGVTMELVS